jgi:hypothetical protein
MRSTNTCSKNVEDRWDKSDCPQVILNGAQPQLTTDELLFHNPIREDFADPSGRDRMVAPGNPGLNRNSWRRFANSICPIRTFELTDFHVFCLH